MRRVIRRAMGAGTVALLLATGVTMAAQPTGPRLAVIKFTAEPTRVELLTVDQSGGRPLRLRLGDQNVRPIPYPSSPVSWRPDGGQVAFSGFTIKKNSRRERLWIFLVRADGSGLRRVPETVEGYGPVFSPDGHMIAFTRVRPNERSGFERAAIWTLDLPTGVVRRLTPWRDGLEYYASSFSPDGSTLLVTRFDDQRADEPEPLAMQLDGTGFKELLPDGIFPVYSPDGSEIVLTRQTADSRQGTDLYVISADGMSLRRLTHSPARSEFFAGWDPSGERIAYMRYPPANSKNRDLENTVMQINADGTCAAKLLSAPRSGFYMPAWQPGPGREAGPISC